MFIAKKPDILDYCIHRNKQQFKALSNQLFLLSYPLQFFGVLLLLLNAANHGGQPFRLCGITIQIFQKAFFCSKCFHVVKLEGNQTNDDVTETICDSVPISTEARARRTIVIMMQLDDDGISYDTVNTISLHWLWSHLRCNFTVVYFESLNLIGYIPVDYLSYSLKSR